MKGNLRNNLLTWSGQHVRIGCKNGSSFVFCKVIDETSEEELEQVEQQIYMNAEWQSEKAKSTLKYLNGMSVQEYIAEENRKNIEKEQSREKRCKMEKTVYKPKTLPTLAMIERNYYRRIASCERTIEKFKRYKKKPHMILDVPVV